MATPEGICIPWEEKPCPWCQVESDGLIAECWNVGPDSKHITERWAIRCQDCGCIGPEAETCAEAWEKWNTRPLPWPDAD